MTEHRLVTRLRELMLLGLSGEEAFSLKYALVASHIADLQKEAQDHPAPTFGEGHKPTAALQILGDTDVQARLRSEVARVFTATGTKSLHELFAFLDAGT